MSREEQIVTSSTECETVGSALAGAYTELSRAGIESPRLTAELLVGFVLGWSRVRTLTRPETLLDCETLRRFKHLVKRRCAGEPLQYIMGEQEFYGLRFLVTPAVLIPRCETEILVEQALELASQKAMNLRFLDVGTGSGCIAVSFARHMPRSRGWAIDRSEEALMVAAHNAAAIGTLERIQFVRGDLLDCFLPRPLFDFIFSNPPYVSRGELEDLPAEVRDYEPTSALLGGESGLDLYERLIPQAAKNLKEGGFLLLEVGAGQSPAVIGLLQKEPFIVERAAEDLRGIPRCIIARRDSGGPNG
jgi:release factor glutamine methyltransferase